MTTPRKALAELMPQMVAEAGEDDHITAAMNALMIQAILTALAPFLIPEGCVAVCSLCLSDLPVKYPGTCNDIRKAKCPLKPKDTP